MIWPSDSDGQTPLDEDDQLGLIPTWIATRGDLNEVEQANIVMARKSWLYRGASPAALLDDLAVRALHRDMFCQVWRWAGRYRSRETNLGWDPLMIATGVHDLVADARYWLEGDDLRPEIARIHHRVVSIHPFPNGNGRHGRLWADLLATAVDESVPTWDVDTATYLGALRHADATDDLTGLVEAMWGG